MRIEDEIKLTFDDVLIRPKRSTLVSRSEVVLERQFKFKHTNKIWTGVPIFSANMDTTGTFETAITLQKHKMLTAIHKFYSIKDWEKNVENLDPDFISVTVGQSKEDLQLGQKIFSLNSDIKYLCIDVANGYREDFINSVKNYRETFPDKIIIAGNVATWEMTEALILAGADIVKIGFGAGADYVMLGGMFAGHKESGGELVTDEEGVQYKDFYGMSSTKAQQTYYGDLAEHRAP